jgi:hypothetical protein
LSDDQLTAIGSVATLSSDVNNLKTTVGDSTSGLVKDVADLQSGKANTATTLAGYGITDAYTKQEVNTAIAGSANTATYNTSTTYDNGTVGAAIKELETASGDYATKTGVAATVNAATASKTGVSLTVAGTPTGTVASTLSGASVDIPTTATVPTLTTWGNDSSDSTATVTLNTTATAVNGTVTSTFTGTGIDSGTATGDITEIDVSVSDYVPGI